MSLSLQFNANVSLLTCLHKLRAEHDATKEKDKEKQQIVNLAAKKRRKTFREKRLALARDAEKARRDTIEATAAQEVRHDIRTDQTRPDKTRQDKTRQDQTRPHHTRLDKTRPDMTREHKRRQV